VDVISMKNKLDFKNNWITVILSIVTTFLLVVFIIWIQFDSFLKGELPIIFAVLVILLLGSYATLEFIFRKYTFFDEEKVTFISHFRVKTIFWSEIKSVSVSNEGVIKLMSDKSSVKIHLNEYGEADELVKFIKSKVIN
jgi:membrane protease YdiL (CAAX protease family)